MKRAGRNEWGMVSPSRLWGGAVSQTHNRNPSNTTGSRPYPTIPLTDNKDNNSWHDPCWGLICYNKWAFRPPL